jgi:hypothetical protein
MHIIKITALALLPLVLGGHARAAENEGKVITLSCDTYYGANKPADRESFQTTTVVENLDEQTMFFLGYILPIYDVDEASINFGARQIVVDYGFSVAITGILDRLTGRLDATTVMSDPTNPNDPNIATLHYDVGCEAT